MNIHEYQAKQLLAKYGVTVPLEIPAKSFAEVKPAAEKIAATGSAKVVVKAQIHAGGRGKGTFKSGFQGGVHLCDTPQQAKQLATQMLGQVLVTHQTGPEGKEVSKVFVGEAVTIQRELYLAILLDRALAAPTLIAS